MGGNAKTTRYLKECMADALIKLLEEKPLHQITVPEITDLAGVGRATYFRNFSQKEDLITFKLTRLVERWREENGQRGESFKEMLDDYFLFHAGIQKLLKLIYARDLQSAVYRVFYQTLVPNADDRRRSYEIRFYSYGVLGMLDEWIKGDFREPPEEMTQMVLSFAREPIMPSV